LSQIKGNQKIINSPKTSNDELIEQTLDSLEMNEPNAFLAMANSPIKLADYTSEETYAAWVILARRPAM